MKIRTLLLTASFAASALCAGLALTFQPSEAQAYPKHDAAPKEEAKAEPVAAKSIPSDSDEIKAVVAKVDQMIAQKWEEAELKPSDAADDSEWLRRVTIDTLGRTPTLSETQAFLSSDLESKRALKIDALLDSDEYARRMGEFWLKATTGFNIGSRRQGLQQLYGYLIDSVAKNTPYDVWVRQILTASGELELIRGMGGRPNRRDPEVLKDPMKAITDGLRENGSPLGYLISFRQEKPNLTGNVSRAFLGIEIQCAQCHDHFYEDWKQDQFRAFSASFRATNMTPESRDNPYTYVVSDRRNITLTDAQFDRFVKRRIERAQRNNEGGMPIANEETIEELRSVLTIDPTTLDGEELSGTTGLELRQDLAQWITSADNQWFTRTAVNRLWGHYLKRGFVDPVDDFNTITEELNEFPELMEYLAEDFAKSGFNLKRMQKIILNTRAYGLSSKHNKSNEHDLTLYSRGYIRQLSTTEVFDSLMSATGVLNSQDYRERIEVVRARLELIQRASQESGDDENRTTESFTGTIPQALEMMNGPLDPSASRGSPLSELLSKSTDRGERIRLMYLAALSREPSAAEARTMERYAKDEKDVVAAYEDIYWALLNSSEFMTNH